MRITTPLLLIVLSGTSWAGTVSIFSDISATAPRWDSMSAWSLGGSNVYTQAAQFTAAYSAKVTQVDLVLSWVWQSDAIVYLMTDSGGKPGTVLEQYSITGIGKTDRLFSAVSLTHPLLTAGTKYWLAATDSNGSSGRLAWYWSSSTTGTMDVKFGSAAWQATVTQTLPAFDVMGTEIPEPLSLGMIGSGLAMLVVAGRRHRRRA